MIKFILALIFFIQIEISTALAMPQIMPLNEVQKGMTGVAYTSIEPSGAIQSFNVKIVGTIAGTKSSQPYIMAEASGDLINRTGGILQGMSGSPVYINGKLVGALSAGFKEMSPYIFLITPIENMLDIWKIPDTFNINPYAEFEKSKTKTDDENNSDDGSTDTDEKNSADDENDEDYEEILTDDEEKATLIYSGFTGAGLKFLKDSLAEFDFKDYEVGSGNSDTSIKYNVKLSGGSPVGVAVVYGDFLVGATGTVTLVDENKLLAFGHKFVHGGNVNYFMTDVDVVGPVPGLFGGMKMASVGSIIGRINQDRNSGVSGIIGQFPSVVPINVTVNGNNYNALIAYNENLMPKLGAAIAYSALGAHLDSEDLSGTVKVSFVIKTNVVDDGNLSRENMYYNSADVGQLAVVELLQALNLICENITAESDILGIDVKMNFDPLRNTASLVKVESEKKSVKPGEDIKLKVTLQPYRRKEIVIEVPYKVPLTAKEGAFVLDVHGGGFIPVTAVQQAGVVTPSTKPPKEVYNEKIQQLLTANKNNEIVIKPAAVVRTEKELKAEIKRVKKLVSDLKKRGIKPTATPPSKFATDYVIDNGIQCTLNVDKL